MLQDQSVNIAWFTSDFICWFLHEETGMVPALKAERGYICAVTRHDGQVFHLTESSDPLALLCFMWWQPQVGFCTVT